MARTKDKRQEVAVAEAVLTRFDVRDTPQMIVDANYGRSSLIVVNESDGDLYLAYGDPEPSILRFTYRVPPRYTFEMPVAMTFVGRIYVASEAGSTGDGIYVTEL